MGGPRKRRLKKRAANRCVQGGGGERAVDRAGPRGVDSRRGGAWRAEGGQAQGRAKTKIPKIHATASATASQTVTTTRDKRHGVRCRNDSRSCPPHMTKMRLGPDGRCTRRSIACGGGRGPTGCARWYSTLVSMRSRLHFFPPRPSVCLCLSGLGRRPQARQPPGLAAER